MTDVAHKNGPLCGGGSMQGVFSFKIYAPTYVEGYKDPFVHMEFEDLVHETSHVVFSDKKGIAQYLAVVTNVAQDFISREAMNDLLQLIGTRKFKKAFDKALEEGQSAISDNIDATIEAITKAIREGFND